MRGRSEVPPRCGDVLVHDRGGLLGERGGRDLRDPVIRRRWITIETGVVVEAIGGRADDLRDVIGVAVRVAGQCDRPFAVVV